MRPGRVAASTGPSRDCVNSISGWRRTEENFVPRSLFNILRSSVISTFLDSASTTTDSSLESSVSYLPMMSSKAESRPDLSTFFFAIIAALRTLGIGVL